MNTNIEEQMMKFVDNGQQNKIIITGHCSGCRVTLEGNNGRFTSFSTGSNIGDVFADALSHFEKNNDNILKREIDELNRKIIEKENDINLLKSNLAEYKKQLKKGKEVT